MARSHFLWPKGNVRRALVSAPRLASVSVIEKQLKRMFPTGHPVLCSSGRAALVLALIESGVSRSDLVGVYPYASHCVLDAISRIATPLSGPTATTAPLRVVYHQWGYVQEIDLPQNSIEDCVDTLCIPGTNLFPGGGRFEVWSLPKILGTTSGGVLWCRDEETANTIRCLRDNRVGGVFQWLLRLLATKSHKAYLFWQSAECELGQVSCFQTGEILVAVQKWDDYVTNRRANLDKVWLLAAEWLPRPSNRLPPVVPIYSDQPETTIRELGISSGYRMIEKLEHDDSRRLVKVLPVPIHQDVAESWLADLIRSLGDQKLGPREI